MSRYRITFLVETDADCADDAVRYFMRRAGKSFKHYRPIEFEKQVDDGWYSMLPDYLKVALEGGDVDEVERASHHLEAVRRRSQFEVITNEISA